MPTVEVGNSINAKCQDALERAIKTIKTNKKWNVKVVYGDTDSMFALVPGRNREEAFRIDTEIAEAVTQANSHLVKLKLENVYQPCILQVGFLTICWLDYVNENYDKICLYFTHILINLPDKKRYVGYMHFLISKEKIRALHCSDNRG
uniref:DNA-directed DNA polymerase n=1 Tax=Glossina austeni TaxID=7395 RepID=A0A1A9VGS2_GLOAU